MITGVRYQLLVGLFVPAILGSWGCAYGPTYVKQAPLSPEVRNQLGTIGVVTKEESFEISYPRPASQGHAAGKGAWATVAFVCQGSGGHPYAALGCLLLAPALAGIGAGVGALMAPSEAAVQDAEAALHEARAALKIAEAIREQVVQTARSQTPHSFVLLPGAGRTVHDQEVAGEESESAGTPKLPSAYPSPQNSESNYSSLAQDGVDTILEIRVSSVDLQKGLHSGEINPSLALAIWVVSRLIRTADGTELYKYRPVCEGGSGTLTEWGADNARLFHEEVNRGVQSLAGEIVAQLFGAPPSPQEQSQPPCSEHILPLPGSSLP